MGTYTRWVPIQDGFNVNDVNNNAQDLNLMHTEILPLVFERRLIFDLASQCIICFR